MTINEKFDEIVLATTNRGKLHELRELLVGCSVRVRCLVEFGEIEDVKEVGSTFAENARQKAMHYSKILNCVVLADDSGLQVDALDGAPGIYSARFAGVEGANRDEANNQKLLRLLAEVPAGKRTARFCCCLCLARAGEVLVEVEGFVEGVIAEEGRGENGFGYDPIFYLPEKGKTIAQLPYEEKNAISHRGRALKKLVRAM
jgi:XTP/dITP diphosphohydrolase